MLLTRAFAVLVSIPLTLGCGPVDRPGPDEGPNVLMIAVDTLRADHLGAWNYERPISPAIDSLAQAGVRFARATAPAPWTLPSIASLNTGLYPASHNLTGASDALPFEAKTLAEVLGAHGFATSAVIGNSLLHARLGHSQGFDSYDTEEARGHDAITTPGITTRAKAELTRLAKAERPFFLSLLYYDPHYDWKSHGYGIADETAGLLPGQTEIHELRERASAGQLSEAERQLLIDRYDEEIRFTDAGIGELLAQLDALGLARNTVVIFVADHGEEFLEHGWLGHTRYLFDGMVHVPLIVSDPRQTDHHGDVIDTRVSTVSVMPTILDLVGIDPSPWAFDAPSLAGAVRGEEPKAQPLFTMVDFEAAQKRNAAKAAHLEAVLMGDQKWIRPSGGRPGPFEVYDLVADPGEQAPRRVPQATPEAAEVRALFQRAHQRFSQRALPKHAAAYSEAELDEMQKLGYLGQED